MDKKKLYTVLDTEHFVELNELNKNDLSGCKWKCIMSLNEALVDCNK